MLESTKVPALTRAIEILNLIGRIGPCSAATIIAELGIPKSTVYLLLGELKKQRFISMDNQDNYCLWTKLVELAGQALSKMDLRELARPRLTRLMDECGLLCHGKSWGGSAPGAGALIMARTIRMCAAWLPRYLTPITT